MKAIYLEIKCLLFVILFFRGSTRYIMDYPDSINNHSNAVEEIQHAICKIATKDIQASANATITRQLKGVCTSKEMHTRLNQLEKRILNEINIIKNALHIPSNELKPKALEKTAHTYNLDDYDYLNTIESVKSEKVFNPQSITYQLLQNNTINDETIATTKEPDVTTTNNLGFAYKRDLEAAKNNLTFQNTELGSSFLYFWKIYDINEILTYSDTDIDSPVFYLSGHPLQLKLYPHHLGTNYVALELSSMDQFVVKHRFTILNQNNEKSDLSSQILGVNAAMFRISNQKLTTGNFTNDGSLMVKVVVALR